jgi:drug/metabolite transporter (DMT)-like permease
MIKWIATLPIPLVLLVAAILEASGDALIRKALFENSGLARILLVLAGAVVMLAYGTFLNLAPLQFGQVVGLYIAILFIVWQAINFLAFGATPTVSILLGGSLIVVGGLLITYWKP